MSIQAPNAHWVVWMSLLVAGVLSILPLPAWLSVAPTDMGGNGHYVLDFSTAQPLWFILRFFYRVITGYFFRCRVWNTLIGAGAGSFCDAVFAPAPADVPLVAADICCIRHYHLLPAHQLMDSNCNGAVNPLLMVFIAFNQQCRIVALAIFHTALFTPLFQSGLEGGEKHHDLPCITVPRRQQLLRQIGVPFQLLAGEMDEAPQAGEPGQDYVVRMAKEKPKSPGDGYKRSN